MNQKEITVATLVRYFRAYKRGELKNEPARLLCDYLDSELEQDDDTPLETAVSAWLATVDLDDLGESGCLGGVTVDEGAEGYVVEYGRGEEYLWLTGSTLLELAQKADNEDFTPFPDWFEHSWTGITLRGAKRLIEELDYAEVIDILAMQGIRDESCDEGDEDETEEATPTFKVGFQVFYDPKEALLELVEDLSTTRRAKVLRGV